MNDSTRPVRPVHPAAPYIGGKRQLARQLVEMIDAVPHLTYVEAFVGMGGVFLRRRRAPPCEVMNDRSGDVATFFRILQRHYVPFMDLLRFQFTSRREFERLMATDPVTLTDLERAVRFLYLQRTAFGGKVAGRNFGVMTDRPGRFDVTVLARLLTDINERLSGVVIENLPYAEVLARYDGAQTLFYLDPPYFGCEGDYGEGLFARDDFARLAEGLRGLAGHFILSINDTPEIREIFDGFEMDEVALTYSIGAGAPTQARELIISSAGLKAITRPPGLFD